MLPINAHFFLFPRSREGRRHLSATKGQTPWSATQGALLSRPQALCKELPCKLPIPALLTCSRFNLPPSFRVVPSPPGHCLSGGPPSNSSVIKGQKKSLQDQAEGSFGPASGPTRCLKEHLGNKEKANLQETRPPQAARPRTVLGEIQNSWQPYRIFTHTWPKG